MSLAGVGTYHCHRRPLRNWNDGDIFDRYGFCRFLNHDVALAAAVVGVDLSVVVTLCRPSKRITSRGPVGKTFLPLSGWRNSMQIEMEHHQRQSQNNLSDEVMEGVQREVKDGFASRCTACGAARTKANFQSINDWYCHLRHNESTTDSDKQAFAQHEKLPCVGWTRRRYCTSRNSRSVKINI